MKNIIQPFMIAAILLFSVQSLFAQCKMMSMNHSDAASQQPAEKETVVKNDSLAKLSFKVYGNCGMCRNRIRKSLKKEGVANSEWNEETQMVEIIYDASIVSPDKLHQYVSETGHDTELMKAPDDVYDKLPGCCQYERNTAFKK